MVREKLAALAVALLLAPVASATWLAGSGTPEPSTSFDTAPFMFQSPNGERVDRVYFNGFLLQSAGEFATDVSLDGARILSPAAYTNAAMLGFWRDCNHDGYVGAKLAPAGWGSLSAYPRTLATSGATTIDLEACPLGSAYNPLDPGSGLPSGYIEEFRWIGPNARWATSGQATYYRDCSDTISFLLTSNCYYLPSAGTRQDVSDALSRVWVDWGTPGGAHLPDGGPVPRGLFNDSNGVMEYVDFYSQHVPSAVLGDVWTGKPNLGKCDETPEFLGGPDETCGLWPLWQAKRLVNDSTTSHGEAAHPTPLVQVFDTSENNANGASPCDDFSLALGKSVPDVSPNANANFLVAGSLAGTVQNLWAASNQGRFDGTCGKGAVPIFSVEYESDDLLTTHVRPDDTLLFTYDQRTHVLRPAGLDDTPTAPTGAHATSIVKGNVGWYGRTFNAGPPRLGWGATTPGSITYYADVTSEAILGVGSGASATTALPAAQQDAYRYGVGAGCPSVTTGPSNVNPLNQWECSASQWLARRDRDRAAGRPLLGDAFDLRDVDCYDDTASNAAPGLALGLILCES